MRPRCHVHTISRTETRPVYWPLAGRMHVSGYVYTVCVCDTQRAVTWQHWTVTTVYQHIPRIITVHFHNIGAWCNQLICYSNIHSNNVTDVTQCNIETICYIGVGMAHLGIVLWHAQRYMATTSISGRTLSNSYGSIFVGWHAVIYV